VTNLPTRIRDICTIASAPSTAYHTPLHFYIISLSTLLAVHQPTLYPLYPVASLSLSYLSICLSVFTYLSISSFSI
ncbi:hypothetical protein BX661DRAFT_188345, partial [Kickxella alabastrina]|uniref:uncharacterized protein n=1 Tax=Kickxella alabastrina TaxID=61397 RepID=UPI0022211838